MKFREILLIFVYLLAVGLANLTMASLGSFGPYVSIVTAFLLIGLTITTRDALHEIWTGRGLWYRMTMLIYFGALISYVSGAKAIALASMVAFAASEMIDAVVYSGLGKYTKFIRINGSNVFSSMADSILFPLIAFPPPLNWVVVVGQFVSKMVGGLLWSFLVHSDVGK